MAGLRSLPLPRLVPLPTSNGGLITPPIITRAAATSTNNLKGALISYLPTLFDAKPMTPSKWPRMPWFTEAVGVHGQGNLSVRADGSVCPIQDP